jgi:hypothetical protein
VSTRISFLVKRLHVKHTTAFGMTEFTYKLYEIDLKRYTKD